MAKNGGVAHWFSRIPDPRLPLPGDREADVCIVGAGYTGLWTAYYLRQLDPALRITVLEARFAGFGASGRNGGWLSGLPPGHRGLLAAKHGRDSVVTWQRLLNEAVDEVIEVADREGIDADIVKGGNLEVARTPAQAKRLRHEVDEDRRWGWTVCRCSPPPRLRPASGSTPRYSGPSTRTAPGSSRPNLPVVWLTWSNASA